MRMLSLQPLLNSYGNLTFFENTGSFGPCAPLACNAISYYFRWKMYCCFEKKYFHASEKLFQEWLSVQ